MQITVNEVEEGLVLTAVKLRTQKATRKLTPKLGVVF